MKIRVSFLLLFCLFSLKAPLARGETTGLGNRCQILLKAFVTRGPHKAIKIWKLLSEGAFTPTELLRQIESVSSALPPPDARAILDAFVAKQFNGKVGDRYSPDILKLAHPAVTKASFPEGVTAYLGKFLEVEDNKRWCNVNPIAVHLEYMGLVAITRPDLNIAMDQLFLKALRNSSYHHSSLFWNANALLEYVGGFYLKYRRPPENFDGRKVLDAFESEIIRRKADIHYGSRIQSEMLEPAGLLLGLAPSGNVLASP